MPDVVIYTKSWCGYCTRAKALLARKGASFSEVEISGDDALRDEMIARAGGRRTVPQIFIGDTHVGGCDDLYELESEGRTQVPGTAPVRAGSVTPRRRFQSW